MTTRRQFIRATLGSSALISLSTSVPKVLLGASARTVQKPQANILVVIQLSGGNDGLNTVVPHGDDQYYKNRFTLAIGGNQVSKIDDYVGFHPAMREMAQLLDDHQLAVVQGVGYPNPNRSHFESMDLWHTAHRLPENAQLGWLGRCLEDSRMRGELPALHYGQGKQPLALATRTTPVPSITSLEQFRLKVSGNPRLTRGIRRSIQAPRDSHNPLLGFIHESAEVALKTSQRLEDIVDTRSSKSDYPETRLGHKLNAVSQLIHTGLPTQIYYVTHEGFDTHSNQLQAHASLLREFSQAASAFMQDMTQSGQADRVAIMTFSEFGRRVRENASRGTDHGTAAPMFIAGGKVNAGLLGKHPSLSELEQGDLKFTTDYRQVYATVMDDWLHIDSGQILGRRFEKLKLFV